MSQHKKTDKAVFTVLLISGREIKHEYDAPLEPDEQEGIIKNIIYSLDKQKSTPLFLRNPSIIYSPDAIASIRFNFVTAKQIEEFRKQMNRTMGYPLKDVK